jgi:hypothetical protein
MTEIVSLNSALFNDFGVKEETILCKSNTPHKLTSAAAAFAQTNFITPINNATTDFNNLIIEGINFFL